MSDYWLFNPSMTWVGTIAMVFVIYFLFFHEGRHK
jgi:hypothetical protein